jgi:hypothetical protein
VGLANLGSESETCVGSRVHLVGVSISFEKYFYRLPFTPPSLVRRIGLSAVKRVTWAKIVQMVTFLNQTLSIMISISLGTIRMELVLGRLVHLIIA